MGPIRGTGGVATAPPSGICSSRDPGRGNALLESALVDCAGRPEDCTTGGGRGGNGASGGGVPFANEPDVPCLREEAERDLTSEFGLGVFDGLRAPTPDPEDSVEGRLLMLEGSDSDDPT